MAKAKKSPIHVSTNANKTTQSSSLSQIAIACVLILLAFYCARPASTDVSLAFTVSSVMRAARTAGCENTHRDEVMCAAAAMKGECATKPGWTLVNCAAACEVVQPGRGCSMLDSAVRCNTTTMNFTREPAFGPGGLDSMFEGLQTSTEWQVFKPRVISHPPHGPWIMWFENFISDKEIDALLKNVDPLEKSMTHSTQEKSNSWRTSQTAWCEEKCRNHPLVKGVVNRISALTGVPVVNFETLQLLRYDVGQFFKVHHDFVRTTQEQLAGPRVLTFFMYLNDVEEGGGTHFPRANVTIKPKKGGAVLWPSTMSEDPHQQLPSTEHEALPVEKGFKLATNSWIHLYDYDTPVRRWDCTYYP